jgi:2-haloacid dehalogenase
MPIARRQLFGMAAGGAVASALPATLAASMVAKPRYKAVAFDAFPIFDPRPVFALAETLFPGRGADLSSAWRTRQFEYQWLHALSRRYADFQQTTEQGLVFAAKTLTLDLTPEKRDQLMDAYLNLKSWPDVPQVLLSLKEAGIRLALLSNMTKKMLDTNARNAGLHGFFEYNLATDQIKTHKPDPRAYQMAIDAFKLRKEEIVYVAHAGWDAAGAKWFGFPTVWVNRLDAPTEELGVAADATGRNLTDLVSFVNGQKEAYHVQQS